MAQVIDDLRQTLTEERTALLRGDLGDIAPLIEKKHRLLERIAGERDRHDPAALRKLRALASRNNELYRAASKGLERIRDRLEAMRAVQGGFRTYGADGQAQTHARPVDGKRI